MVELIDTFNKAGVYFKSLSEPEFNTASANGKFLLPIFAAVAEFERNLISERTKVGLANARKRNKLLGRPTGSKKETIEKYHFAKYLYDKQDLPIKIACNRSGISKSSFYRVEKVL